MNHTVYKLWDRKTGRHHWQLVTIRLAPFTAEDIAALQSIVWPNLGQSKEAEEMAIECSYEYFQRKPNDSRVKPIARCR